MTTKTELHQLIDELPDAATNEAKRRLEELRDPVLAAFINAPIDDEPVTAEELAALAESRAAAATGDVASWDDVKRRLHSRDAV